MIGTCEVSRALRELPCFLGFLAAIYAELGMGHLSKEEEVFAAELFLRHAVARKVESHILEAFKQATNDQKTRRIL